MMGRWWLRAAELHLRGRVIWRERAPQPFDGIPPEIWRLFGFTIAAEITIAGMIYGFLWSHGQI
jgi:hypothetical protein